MKQLFNNFKLVFTLTTFKYLLYFACISNYKRTGRKLITNTFPNYPYNYYDNNNLLLMLPTRNSIHRFKSQKLNNSKILPFKLIKTHKATILIQI